MTTTASANRYQLYKSGPHCWYVQEVATRELKALPFRTRKAAQAAVDSLNAPKR